MTPTTRAEQAFQDWETRRETRIPLRVYINRAGRVEVSSLPLKDGDNATMYKFLADESILIVHGGNGKAYTLRTIKPKGPANE